MNFDDRLMKYKYDAILPRMLFGSLLDIGCGTGHFLYLMRNHQPNKSLTGIDVDVMKIIVAKYYIGNVKFLCGLFEEYDGDGRWNNITAFNVLEHVDDTPSFLWKCHKHLKSDGRIFITVPNAIGLHKRIGDNMGLSHPYRLTKADREKGHRRVFDMKTLEQLLDFCGFNVIATQGIFLKPFPSDVMMQHYDEKLFDALYEIGKELPEYCSSIMVVGEKR